jgi:hypothetical protein
MLKNEKISNRRDRRERRKTSIGINAMQIIEKSDQSGKKEFLQL